MDIQTFSKMKAKQAEARALVPRHRSPNQSWTGEDYWLRFRSLGQVVIDASVFPDRSCDGDTTFLHSVHLPDNIVVRFIAKTVVPAERNIAVGQETVTVTYPTKPATADDLWSVRVEWAEEGQELAGHVEEVYGIRPRRVVSDVKSDRLLAVEESFAVVAEHDLAMRSLIRNA